MVACSVDDSVVQLALSLAKLEVAAMADLTAVAMAARSELMMVAA